MKPILLTTLLCQALLPPSHGAPGPDSSLLLWLPLGDGSGSLALDRSPNRLEAGFVNVQKLADAAREGVWRA